MSKGGFNPTRSLLALFVLSAGALLVFGFLGAGVNAPFSVPAANAEQEQVYARAVAEVNRETGLNILYVTVMSLDAVRIENDFSRGSAASAQEVARAFAKKTEKELEVDCAKNGSTGVSKQSGGKCYKTEVVYDLRPVEEVVDILKLDENQKKLAGNILATVYAYTGADNDGMKAEPGSGPCSLNGTAESVGPYAWPTPGQYSITECYGWRIHPTKGTRNLHEGWDVGAPFWTPIVAVADGQVRLAGVYGGYGNAVILDHAIGGWSIYGHMIKMGVSSGEQVKSGEVIGWVGSTGNSTGPHIHFEIHGPNGSIDPKTLYR